MTALSSPSVPRGEVDSHRVKVRNRTLRLSRNWLLKTCWLPSFIIASMTYAADPNRQLGNATLWFIGGCASFGALALVCHCFVRKVPTDASLGPLR